MYLSVLKWKYYQLMVLFSLEYVNVEEISINHHKLSGQACRDIWKIVLNEKREGGFRKIKIHKIPLLPLL